MIRTCVVCGVPLAGRKHNALTCSDRCRAIHNSDLRRSHYVPVVGASYLQQMLRVRKGVPYAGTQLVLLQRGLQGARREQGCGVAARLGDRAMNVESD